MTIEFTGSVNGDTVNSYEVNGGVFRLPASGAAMVAVEAALSAVRRTIACAAGAVVVEAAAMPVRRVMCAGASQIVVNAGSYGARRFNATGASRCAIDAATAPGVRRSVAGASLTVISGGLKPGFSWLQRAPRERTITANREIRTIVIPADPPIPSLGARGSVLIGTERRKA